MKKVFTLFAVLAMVLAAGYAFAGNDTENLHVYVNAEPYVSCYIESLPNLNFGTYYTNIEDPITTSSLLEIWCDGATDWTLDAGAGQNSFNGMRRMNNGIDYLQYQLYTENSYSTVWGTYFEGSTLTGSSSGYQNITYYARIPGSQYVGTGEYTDIVQVSLNW